MKTKPHVQLPGIIADCLATISSDVLAQTDLVRLCRIVDPPARGSFLKPSKQAGMQTRAHLAAIESTTYGKTIL